MNDIKKSKNREKKEVVVAELSEKVQKAKALVFANYAGMTHKQIEDLKKALRASEAELAVTKNTLLKIALEQNKKADTEMSFDGPTLTLFAYADAIAPLKELAKSIKTTTLPVIKAGIFEGKIVTADQVVKLSTLPPREVLIAQFVGGLKSPLYGLHRSLQWNLSKLVMTLHAVESSKSQAPSSN